MTVTKTIYETFRKIVLDNGLTGIMIDQDYYDEMTALGMNDDQIFNTIRVV